MQSDKISKLQQGFHTAFIDCTADSNLAYKPQFLSNNHRQGSKVLSSIEDELLSCNEFSISVAFITMSGITPLLQTLKELEKRNVKGYILTTDYLNFSEPKALEKLASLKNITIKIYGTEAAGEGFHTKGYIFRNEELYRIILGSSNMTLSALTTNREWNTKIISTEQGEYTKEVVNEFNQLWNSDYAFDYEDFIDRYTIKYEIIKKQRKAAKSLEIPSLDAYRLQPNSMQVEFVGKLKKLLAAGERRGLLISATGTGKTYASAFAIRELSAKKALFLVHREQIAKQAMKSFRNVFGGKRVDGTPIKYGLVSGNSKDYNADLVFSTMQMMAKEEIFTKFKRDEFDFIVLDEAHRAGARSYQTIVNYFEPGFLLGMTASPERSDDFDVFQLFDHNIAYEIRLQQALEENMLCPFHYFGISDMEVHGEVIGDADNGAGLRNFTRLTETERVDFIIEQARYYGYSGDRVKGLVFCSRKDEAEELSKKFNAYGYRTAYLCGDDSQEKREKCIELLTACISNADEEYLDYIFTVDIFNEGVDIPEVNQVIMLRPTQSPIIFIQQLGRGLRKSEDKEYVVILDFIGNYTNNFMIPIALSGDRTYNKDNMRKYVREGVRIIPGASTIHFDEISKKRIFQSIDKMVTKKKMLAEKYRLLKYRLGRIPTILDFYEYGEIDPMLFVEYAGSYDRFLRSIDKDYHVTFSEQEEEIIQFISSLLINGKRPHELLMLQLLLEQGGFDKEIFKDILQQRREQYREADYIAAYGMLGKEFINSASDKKNYQLIEFLEYNQYKNDTVSRAASLTLKILHLPFKKELEQLITYGLKKYEDIYVNHDEDNLVLYEKYSRKDVCRILNWEHDESATIYGYRIKYNACPIFVTYEKKENIASSTKYNDQFLNEQIFSWMTRSKVTMESPETKKLIHYQESGLKIFLFIKKSDGEGTDFYYMGKAIPVKWQQSAIKNDKGIELPIMNFQLKLEHSVRNDIYEYFTK